ncbi:putative alpha-ketoglutarate-dependent taurine dioxygenase protein [Neofusicoccum parvum UCRNP2]|uniref:Putative alpha-ketoglutarate-dependent taurine dioxygenase protein n=1 Tax=Botryosphaeria parva (strain UCR-NP2) TaxID=1287680 RepID=R1GJW5_BOTPV|nr:putative alpha-ketoglutarate-dependent taurine dioxygenase protein [Neofusicoccum parvum UCRNP2]
MAPSAIEHEVVVPSSKSEVPHREPLKLSGALDKYESFEVTPIIGTEFKDVNLAEWINAPNSDELLRDLAITISRRGVVFFRAQDDLTNELQKKLNHRLGELTGKPSTSSLHIHPILNDDRELGGSDPEISTISSEQRKKYYDPVKHFALSDKKQESAQWHSDIQFEPVPADYTSLRLVELPRTGGDTLWASGYDLYDRLSAPYQRFVETLTADFEAPFFNDVAAKGGFGVYTKPRGSPHNVGEVLRATHPVVRTNPVTGWKSLFPVGAFPKTVNGLTKQEGDHLLKWFLDLVYKNHELQVRFRWRNKNDIAIWDNRSVFHTATFDYDNIGPRFGNRAVGIGERPYFDPKSESRRVALAREEEEAKARAEAEA